MKKNVMMRVAAMLLVCVMATTCGISGTFAKYVTSGSSNDFARVAKFGVDVTATGSLFSDSYLDVKTDYTTNETLETITVQASTQYTNLVAPGTEGSLAMFTVTGTPEVDVLVKYEANLEFGDNWMVDVDDNGVMEEYCPIVITVVYQGNTTVFSMKDYANVNAFETAFENFVNTTLAARYHTNQDLSAVNDDLTISWRWYFENTTAGNPLIAYQDDYADTDLGDAAAAGTPGTITLDITCTITQID